MKPSVIVDSLSAENQLSTSLVKQKPKQELAIPKHELAIRSNLTFFNTITSYSLPTITTELSAENKTIVRRFNEELPEINNPLILNDRNKALEKINSMLSEINKIKKEIESSVEETICPYEKTKLEYLGSNFIVPSIHDLAYPKHYSAEKAADTTVGISKKYNEIMCTQLQQMTAVSIDKNFSGIFPEYLGNAFAVLSATATGEEYVVDRHKLALHLEFAEMVKNISVEDIIKDPFTIAHKLVSRFIEINSDMVPLSSNFYRLEEGTTTTQT